MVTGFLEVLAHGVIVIISTLGYLGIVLTMTIESACIPLPSEIIMPFSGYLASIGRFSLFGVAVAGAFGNLLGSWIAYAAGYFGGEPFVARAGKYILLSAEDLRASQKWFGRFGEPAVLVSRLLPIVRTFISLPAGMARMNLARFSFYTFAGSLPWCLGLAWVGFTLGEKWPTIRGQFHRFDFAVGFILVLGIAWFIKRHFKGDAAHA